VLTFSAGLATAAALNDYITAKLKDQAVDLQQTRLRKEGHLGSSGGSGYNDTLPLMLPPEREPITETNRFERITRQRCTSACGYLYVARGSRLEQICGDRCCMSMHHDGAHHCGRIHEATPGRRTNGCGGGPSNQASGGKGGQPKRSVQAKGGPKGGAPGGGGGAGAVEP
jgi:hypothetical protein